MQRRVDAIGKSNHAVDFNVVKYPFDDIRPVGCDNTVRIREGDDSTTRVCDCVISCGSRTAPGFG